jgi:glycosyltransferase involved in cell wall biosynthesis
VVKATARSVLTPPPTLSPASVNWHIITGEYPPQRGGVSDYTELVARGLADAGDSVVVWAPPAGAPDLRHAGVEIRRLPDCYGPRSLRMLSADLDRAPALHRVLVQYVPHAFGWKGANVPFCLWLRSRRRDSIWVMFHEVAFPFDPGGGLALNMLAGVNKVMASLVGGAAERAFVSIPAWRSGVGSVTSAGTPVTWLPVPSAIPVVRDGERTALIRARYSPRGQALVGHFGTYGGLIKPLLERTLIPLIDGSDCRALLLGQNSDTVCAEFVGRNPRMLDRIYGVGQLPADDLSLHVSACDVMLQPYPDGISSRRTSAMVALAHGIPVVSATGPLTEAIWEKSGIAVLATAPDAVEMATETVALLRDPARRASISRLASALYDEQFDIRHTISALRCPS